MGMLDALIFGVRYIFQGSTAKPERSRLSFGDGFTVTDDDENDWLRIEVTPAGATGNASGVFNSDAVVQKWAPAGDLTGKVYAISGAGFVTTTDSVETDDIEPELGEDEPLEIDEASFVVFVSAIVTGRVNATNWATFRVSRSFVRHASGAVTAGATTSDDGKDRQGTASSVPWTVPSITWNTTDKFPKITVNQGAETANVEWRATVTAVVHVG